MAKTDVSQDALPHPQQGAPHARVTHADRAIGKSRFWRHFVEMVIAMVVGMAVLGLPLRAIFASLGFTWDEAVARFPEIACIFMTLNMAIGMVAWMRLRGHGWRASVEMTLAMYAATAIALGMLWQHVISEDLLFGLMHVLMVPAMLLAMLYRREEYAYGHH